MLNAFMVTVSLVTLVYTRYVERFPHQGEGIVTIYLSRNPENHETFDPARVFKTYRYFIKGDKILKKDSVSGTEQPRSSSSKTMQLGRGKMISSGGVRTINSVYLINLATGLTYTYYKKDKKLYIAVDSLSRHIEDNFYRNFMKSSGDVVKYFTGTTPEYIAGKPCFPARVMGSGGKDTVTIKYTKIPLKVKSPFNCLFPKFPFQILAIDFAPKRKGAMAESLHMRIESIRETKLPDSMFKLPPNAGLKYNVSTEDLLKGAVID